MAKIEKRGTVSLEFICPVCSERSHMWQWKWGRGKKGYLYVVATCPRCGAPMPKRVSEEFWRAYHPMTLESIERKMGEAV